MDAPTSSAAGEKCQRQASTPAAAVAVGEKKRNASTSGAAADGTSPPVDAPFETAHQEFRDAAAAVAAPGVTLRTIVFFPGMAGAEQVSLRAGASTSSTPAQAQAKRVGDLDSARKLIERDVSKMSTLDEVMAHQKRLMTLRKAVVRKLEDMEKKAEASNVGAGDGDDDDNAGRNKIRRIE
uniref:Uncharacterized protein n=1 Tax=Oryza brachyantha TaxID=4533 RepID=J3MQ61_ORYBR